MSWSPVNLNHVFIKKIGLSIKLSAKCKLSQAWRYNAYIAHNRCNSADGSNAKPVIHLYRRGVCIIEVAAV